MKTSGLGLSIAVLAFGASTIYMAVQLSEERGRSEQLTGESRALNARIAELEKAREAPLPISESFGAINMAPMTMGAPPPPGTSELQPDAQGAIANMPPQSEAFQKMMRAQNRAYNKQMYAEVGTQLGLTRQELSELIDLLTDQQAGGFEILRGVTDPAERQRLMEEALRENKAKIADLLGPDRLQSFEDYQQSLPARQQLDVLVRQIEGSDAAPLNDDQRKRLLAALIEERKRIPSPPLPTAADHTDYAKAYSHWLDDYTARVAAQARSILNTEQYAAYEGYLKWQKEVNEQLSTVRIQDVGNGNVMFTAVAPGVIVGESAGVAVTATDEKPRKKP